MVNIANTIAFRKVCVERMTKLSEKIRRLANLPPEEIAAAALLLADEQAKEERRSMLHCERQRRYRAKNVTMTQRHNDGERHNDANGVTMTNGVDLTHKNGVTMTLENLGIYKKDSKKERKKEYTQDFETFWNLYPKKVAKIDAFKVFSRLIKQKVPLTAILDGLKKFSFGDDPQFVPFPATWLNKRRWEDQPLSNYHSPPTYDVRKHLV